MNTERLKLLQQQISIRPSDPFPRYAYALELRESGDTEQAVSELQKLTLDFPSYVPTYFHLGQLLENQHEQRKAREAYKVGIKKAEQAGDMHALSELQGALQILNNGS